MKGRLITILYCVLFACAAVVHPLNAATARHTEGDDIEEIHSNNINDSEEEEDATDEESEFEERLNPPSLTDSLPTGGILRRTSSIPPYINLAANHIALNGDDWSDLSRNAHEGATFGVPFTILQIGDSHTQADVATSMTRSMLQNVYGNAGRGLITPLKMTKTNEPRDYSISSESKWRTAKLMKTPWESPMMFTGTSITPCSTTFSLEIATLSSDRVPRNPFSILRIFYEGDHPFIIKECSSDNQPVIYNADYDSKGIVTVELSHPVDYVKITMQAQGAPSQLHIGGVELLNNWRGLLYHTIGNNGAMYMSYNTLSDFRRISELHPQLVIIALGANEAFGKISDEAFESTIDRMVHRVHDAVPDAHILLVTPMECQRHTRRATSQRRRRKATASAFEVNANILRLRNVIKRYGETHNVAVYDQYDVAGGDGASQKWLADGLLNPRDRIHLTVDGYNLQGMLMGDALLDALEFPYTNKTTHSKP